MKMNITKIFKVKVAKKPSGQNSLWLVRCNDCGELFYVWDTVLYNRTCPKCHGLGQIPKRDKKDIKDAIFRFQRRLLSEYKRNNAISCKEVALLTEFRERESLSVLEDLLSDCFFKPSEYIIYRKVEWTIDKRGRELLNNQNFIDLLRECYCLIIR